MTWRELGAQLDAVVDSQWGERFRVLPMLPDGGGTDFSRPVVDVVGKLMLSADTVIAAGGEAGAVRTGAFISRLAQSENAIHISARQLPYELHGGDRIHALEPERNDTLFEVSHYAPSFDDGIIAALLLLPRTA